MIQDSYKKAIAYVGKKYVNDKVSCIDANYLTYLSTITMEIFVAFNKEPNFNLEIAIQTALLHDILDNTKTNFNDLKEQFGTHIATTVLAITKDKTIINKEDSIKNNLKRINATFKEATVVKLAELITKLDTKNCDIQKFNEIINESKYFLENLKNKNYFLENRLKELIEKNKEF
ncbi:guanosine-3',5'-bis(diphosphate) 3'-pyrophosphohydrolase [Hypnocyclicus thermotrophus]|uniref:Guanosine-3',5'-bis(Diphosphate) 3'-pyrophosphohydrolase n=1 Tax=Hypnocyclicus thermotrophus TaxID=1627895 RepID=A0AA46DZ00_9FUSO|nr:bifunctional (p)ppGpp synthetase/guanosine-3',5'-bis(diphosphate) 3'-pyrophosphohydrolase [Hypnocyclicus thermotrophus]TDT71365.1 guanosine-3',5'-bis(diphosphate) 3'-pyrophosphohydrolase [Hypnocyclicus thermotrophus]